MDGAGDFTNLSREFGPGGNTASGGRRKQNLHEPAHPARINLNAADVIGRVARTKA